jgi:hypothetical protein
MGSAHAENILPQPPAIPGRKLILSRQIRLLSFPSDPLSPWERIGEGIPQRAEANTTIPWVLFWILDRKACHVNIQ